MTIGGERRAGSQTSAHVTCGAVFSSERETRDRAGTPLARSRQ